MKELGTDGKLREFAKRSIQTEQDLKDLQDRYINMQTMFIEARDIAMILKAGGEGKNGAAGTVDLHWDLLQVRRVHVVAACLSYFGDDGENPSFYVID